MAEMLAGSIVVVAVPNDKGLRGHADTSRLKYLVSGNGRHIIGRRDPSANTELIH